MENAIETEKLVTEAEEVGVINWEVLTLAMAFTAEQLVYDRPVDFDNFVATSMRNKMIDVFVQLLGFK